MNRNRSTAWVLLVLLACIWGSSFILMKRGLEAFDPFQVGALRMVLSAAVLFPVYLLFRKKRGAFSRKQWGGLIATGLLGNGIPAFLFPLAETGINSASAGVLNSLTPLWTWVLGVYIFSLAFSWKQMLGVVIGFLGAIILVFAKGESVDLWQNLGYSSFVIIASVCYALSSNIIKKYLSDLDALTISAYALLIGAIPGLPYLLVSDLGIIFQEHTLAWPSFGYIAILAVIGTALALLIFNQMLHLTDPIFASSVTYLIPIVAMVWGFIDGEHILFAQVVGMAIILSGVYLVTRTKK